MLGKLLIILSEKLVNFGCVYLIIGSKNFLGSFSYIFYNSINLSCENCF